MLPCRQTSSILANKLQYLNLDDTRSTSKGLRVLCEKVDFHRTGAYHHHNNRFCNLVLRKKTLECKRNPEWKIPDLGTTNSSLRSSKSMRLSYRVIRKRVLMMYVTCSFAPRCLASLCFVCRGPCSSSTHKTSLSTCWRRHRIPKVKRRHVTCIIL